MLIYHCSYDVVFAMDAKAIVQKFLEFNSKSVFSAEQFCWPDKSLAVSNGQTLMHLYSQHHYCQQVIHMFSIQHTLNTYHECNNCQVVCVMSSAEMHNTPTRSTHVNVHAWSFGIHAFQ